MSNHFVKNFVIKAIKTFYKIKKEVRWLIQIKYWRKRLSPISSIELDCASKFLILAPHADDEWIGCSQIISNYKNVTILNMDMRGEDSKETHELRYQEMMAIAKEYKTCFKTLSGDKISSLKTLLEKESYDYVCLPYYFDWHPEHIEVMNILRESICNINKNLSILMYQVSLPICQDAVNFYIPMEKCSFKKKWFVFRRNYRTQSNFPYKRFMANECINGALSKTYAAEVYRFASLNQWLLELKNGLLTESEVSKVITGLQNITTTRNYLSTILMNKNIKDE